MAASPSPGPFVIVRHRPGSRALLIAAAVVWLLSLLGVYLATRHFAVPELGPTRAALERVQTELAEAQAKVETQRQRIAVLKRSDQVSRGANQELQATLTERDEEIAGLRADVNFYERLVGGSAQRQGLAVHGLTLTAGGNGAWRYQITLTQTLKKGKVSRGSVTISVDGVRDGKLATLGWAALVQRPGADPQGFSFKYFQELEGELMIPAGFSPTRVRVAARGDAGTVERSFTWDEATGAGANVQVR